MPDRPLPVPSTSIDSTGPRRPGEIKGAVVRCQCDRLIAVLGALRGWGEAAMNQVPSDSASSSAGGTHTRTRRIAPFVWAGGIVLILVVAAGGYLAAGVAVASRDRQEAEAVVQKARTDSIQTISNRVTTAPSL